MHRICSWTAQAESCLRNVFFRTVTKYFGHVTKFSLVLSCTGRVNKNRRNSCWFSLHPCHTIKQRLRERVNVWPVKIVERNPRWSVPNIKNVNLQSVWVSPCSTIKQRLREKVYVWHVTVVRNRSFVSSVIKAKLQMSLDSQLCTTVAMRHARLDVTNVRLLPVCF